MQKLKRSKNLLPAKVQRRSFQTLGGWLRRIKRACHTRCGNCRCGYGKLCPLYADDMSLADKIQTVCKRIYRADEALMDKKIRDQLHLWKSRDTGICQCVWQKHSTVFQLIRTCVGHLIPQCSSPRSTPKCRCRLHCSVCGEIMTMPGLPRKPAAETICLNDEGLEVSSKHHCAIFAPLLFRTEYNAICEETMSAQIIDGKAFAAKSAAGL